MNFNTVFCGLALSAAALAQSAPAPLVAGSMAIYGGTKANILKSADMVPESMWSYRPTPAVRSFGELFAHIADGQYEFCGAASEGKAIEKDIEKTKKTKADVVAALKEAFGYCDAAYAKITAASATEPVTFFGNQLPRITVMDFNGAHNMEHYGNVVTYLRLNKLVPPSSKK